MPRPKRPVTSPRRVPLQARSSQLVADILEGAIRVLRREGAQRFTTIRVAEEAGVSVGSLYQYFPNKQSILFRLQIDEWEENGKALDAILGDTRHTPRERLRDTLLAFFQSECDEAPLRLALAAAAPAYHDAPEARSAHQRSERVVNAFVAAAAPRASKRQRSFAAQLISMTMSSLGKQLSERNPSRRDIESWADALAEMLISYLAQLAPKAGRPRRVSQ